MRGGGAIGGGMLRRVEDVDSPRLCMVGRRSGELPPCGIVFSGALAGILDGLFWDAADMELANALGLREMLAPKLLTGVFERLGGGPRTVEARPMVEADFETESPLEGIVPGLGVLDRGGGAALASQAYNSSR